MKEPSEELNHLAASVVDAALEVHRLLGAGFLESTYEQALAIELNIRGVPFSQQHPISLIYKGHTVGETRLDLLVGDQLVVELKAVENLLPIHKAQVINYLKASERQLGLLINFNVPLLKDGIKRIVFSQSS